MGGEIVDVQDEEYEFIPVGQELNGRANGVSRSDWAVISTLSSKAGTRIILVSLPSFPLICGSLFSSQFFHLLRVCTTSLLSFGSVAACLAFFLSRRLATEIRNRDN